MGKQMKGLEMRLRSSVERLAAGHREPGTQEHAAAADWIAGELRAAGFEVDIEEVSSNGQRCRNVICRPWPAEGTGSLVVVGAHYDTAPGTPGADDNASAVAALLEIARHIGSLARPRGRSVQLVAYDLEEYGFVGSQIHARNLRSAAAPVDLMICLEMLGFTAPTQELPSFLEGRREIGDFIGLCANERTAGPLSIVDRAFRSDAALPLETLVVPGEGQLFPESRLSDHSSFWDEGFPALPVTDTSFLRNPHYHLPSDTPETLDFPFLARVTAALQRATEDLLGADPEKGATLISPGKRVPPRSARRSDMEG